MKSVNPLENSQKKKKSAPAGSNRKFSPFDYVQKDLPSGRNITADVYRYFDNYMVVAVMCGSDSLLKSGLPRAMNDMYVNRLPKSHLSKSYNTLMGYRYNGSWVGICKNVVYDNEDVIFKVQAFFECTREKALAHMSQGIYDIEQICDYYDMFIKDFSRD